MSKVTKKELARKIEALEKFTDYADKMLTQLNHALPEPLEIKHWRDEQADHDELMEILDSKEPKLKQLDQSVFDGASNDKRFFAIDEDGQGWFYRDRPSINEDDKRWTEPNYTSTRAGVGYDTSNWRDSLIERESKELTGGDLCRYLKGCLLYTSPSPRDRG